MKTNRTPKTLSEAIQNALCETSSGPNVVQDIHAHIRDFLSQKFTYAICKADPEMESVLRDLWEEVSK